MNFSATTEYAIRILVFMAQDETRLLTSKDIFDHVQIPFRYLRRQLTNLTKSGFIHSVQGKNGGYQFTKKPSDISLLDIVKSVDNSQLESQCFFGFGNCALIDKCAMHDKWTEIQNKIMSVLSNTTLQELKDHGSHSFVINNK